MCSWSDATDERVQRVHLSFIADEFYLKLFSEWCTAPQRRQ